MGGTFEQTTRAVVIQGEHVLRAGLESNFADPAKVFAATHHYGGFGVANEVLNLSALVSRVQRQEHIARAQSGQLEHDGFHRLLHLHRHA